MVSSQKSKEKLVDKTRLWDLLSHLCSACCVLSTFQVGDPPGPCPTLLGPCSCVDMNTYRHGEEAK